MKRNNCLIIILFILALISTISPKTITTISAKETPNKTLIIYSEGEAYATPNTANIYLIIDTIDTTDINAKILAQKEYNSLKEKLPSINISEESMIINNIYTYALNSIDEIFKCHYDIIIHLDNLDSIHDIQSLENNYIKICNVDYLVSNYNELYNIALRNAIDNAKQKAFEITGNQSLMLIKVTEDNMYYPMYCYRNVELDNIQSELKIDARIIAEFII